MTSPYAPAFEQLVRSPLEHRYTVTVTDAASNVIPLQVTACTVTLDESWSPYPQGTISVVVPDDQAVLDALDPRLLVRCEIAAGYVAPATDQPDVHPLASLYLAGRTVSRPDDRLRLSVQGEEYLRERVRTASNADWAGASWTAATTARDILHACLYAAGAVPSPAPGDTANWRYTDAPTDTDLVEAADTWVPGAGDAPLSIARDVADRAGAWFRCDEAGVWRCGPRPELAAAARHQLQVGAAGTIVGAETTMSRDGWANHAVVHVRWRDAAGVDRTSVGQASASGVYAPGLVGKATDYRLWENRKASTAAVTRAAQTRLTRLASRGRGTAVDAVAAYWLRPGDTVTLQLPTGPPETHLISSVTFDLDAGSMSLTTRTPQWP